MNLIKGFIILVISSTVVFAQKSVSLPSGDLVAYGKIQCGQVKDSWIPGQIKGNGTFLSFEAQISRLNKLKKATSDKKKRASLAKQIKSLKSRMNKQKDTCLLFGARVKKPTTTQSAFDGYTPVTGAHDLTPSSYEVGSTHNLFCGPNESGGSIWGTYIYTADSAVCTAAVHAGLINKSKGGNFKVKIKAGQELYLPSLRNSVTSLEYRNYTKSYVFLNPDTLEEITSSVPTVISWNMGLTGFRALTNALFTFICPANGTIGSVWGTNTYTDDSKICSAAVHAKKISAKKGGVVNVRIKEGLSSYTGSKRNGVTSDSYGSWAGSFSFE